MSYDGKRSHDGWQHVQLDLPPYPEFDDMMEWCHLRFGECCWIGNPRGVWTLQWKERPSWIGFRNGTDALLFLMRWS